MSFNSRLLYPEVTFKTSRSGGSGGQHVNKVSTKVELSFSIAASQILTDEQKDILLKKLHNKLTRDNILQVVAQSERSQPGNKQAALEKFSAIIEKSLVVPKKRKPTKATKASKEKRLQLKKRLGEVKRLRKNEF